MSTNTPPSQNSQPPTHGDRAASGIKQEAPDDSGGPMNQPLLHAVQMPATDDNPGHAISMPPVPVNQHSLAQFYRNGEYSDLKVVSNGFECRVHKIIICSESSVIKDLCRRLVSPYKQPFMAIPLSLLNRASIMTAHTRGAMKP